MLHNDVLVPAVQQCESAIGAHIAPPSAPPSQPPIPPLWVLTERQAELPVSYNGFPRAVSYVRVLLSIFPSWFLGSAPLSCRAMTSVPQFHPPLIKASCSHLFNMCQGYQYDSFVV